MGCLYKREAGERGEGNVPTKEETGVMAAHQGMLATSPARVSEESHLPPPPSLQEQLDSANTLISV